MTTALGLGVLAASPLLASQQFGITAAITIAYSLIVSIVLVPPAMTIWGAYQNMRLRSMVEREWSELDVAIEDVYRATRAGRRSVVADGHMTGMVTRRHQAPQPSYGLSVALPFAKELGRLRNLSRGLKGGVPGIGRPTSRARFRWMDAPSHGGRCRRDGLRPRRQP